MSATGCTWCGAEVAAGDGFRAYGPAGQRRARFCRLEHVVAWGLRGAHWEAGEAGEAARADEAMTECAWCRTALCDAHVLLVRARGEHRIPDGFCTVDHMVSWSKAGGRWAAPD